MFGSAIVDCLTLIGLHQSSMISIINVGVNDWHRLLCGCDFLALVLP